MGELAAVMVGCGPRAAAHAEAYAAGVRAARLVACCDVDGARLQAFGDRFGIARRFADAAEMMRVLRPDLVHVVTSPPQRPSVLAAILGERPRAVLVEKPLARRPEEARAWLEGCARAGVALFVNHQLRFHDCFARAKEVLRGGALGPLEFGRASCRGNLLEQGTHLFDLLSFLFDDAPVEWVLAQCEGAAGYEGSHSAPDYAVGAALFPGGVHVAFECGSPAGSWRQEPNYWLNKGFEFVGARGRVGASTNHGWWAQTEAGLQGETVPYAEEDLRAQARLTESVLLALDRPEAHPSHASTARISFDLVVAVQRSALLRRRVDPREPGRDEEIEALRAALAARGGGTAAGADVTDAAAAGA